MNIKMYSLGKSMQYLAYVPMYTDQTAEASVPTFTYGNGTTYNKLYWNKYNVNEAITNIRIFANLSAIGTASDYEPNDYSVEDNAGTTVSVENQLMSSGKSYACSFTAAESDVNLKGFKFKRTLNSIQALVLGVFFDEPVTVRAGETYTCTIAFNF